ncbi:MAG: zinc-binding alcohol dehydrogenase family protein [Actinomycetaceae bacterium]|nr:zinc-binding alcohol dehydrogenase family protein [Actinomycetaceae bacterium]MDY6083370.1 zinc-binding alcohol dehydrogenase family protein [Actinomycetaceae bacterium]
MKTRAIGFHQHRDASDPQSLVEETIELPSLQDWDLLVQVQAVAVNPIDTKLRRGLSGSMNDPEAFYVLGYDAAGIVIDAGKNATRFTPGDRVFWMGTTRRPGANAQLQVVDSRLVGHAPEAMEPALAAALPLTALTAWEVLFSSLGITERSSGILLLVGATGGVGTAALQLLREKAPGVRVIATAHGEDRQQWVRDLGAWHTVDHRGDLGTQVHDLAPEGVRWIFSTHTPGNSAMYAQVIAPYGDIAVIDTMPDDVSVFKPKSVAFHWYYAFSRTDFGVSIERDGEILEYVRQLADSGRYTQPALTNVGVINAQNLRTAHNMVENDHTLGKIVLSGWE